MRDALCFVGPDPWDIDVGFAYGMRDAVSAELPNLLEVLVHKVDAMAK